MTKPIHYNDNCTLAEFFCQYHKAPAEVHGIDTTVTVLTDCEKLLAGKCLGLTEDVPFMKMTVPTPNSNLEYIIPAPIVGPYTSPGWAICGFVGYDLQRHKSVFIKDTWWVDLPDITKEGNTYQLLAASKVKNIALCSAAGDIENQTTLTHLYKDRPWACKTKMVLVPHHHYQLELDVIGNPDHFFIITGDVALCAGCIGGNVLYMYCPATTHF